jgi:glutamate---cysteine ligase / carboxylate-amine ligase
MDIRNVGVEEEFLLVDPATGEARAAAGAVLRAAAARESGDPGAEPPDYLEFELQRQQVEINTSPCQSLDDLAREVTRCRAQAAKAASAAGAGLAALATSPLPVEPVITADGRYRRMADAFGLTASEQLTCGMHVHVEVSSADEGVAVIDRIQPWLPALVALSANSPFWQGRDSAYDSYRWQAWGRWPSAGPTGWFGSARAYAETVEAMIETGTVLDAGMVYFSARLSDHYPTVEIRVADVCLLAADAVLLAALIRALAETEAQAWRDQAARPPARLELLRLAGWRASRSGLDGDLIHPGTGRPAPARQVIEALAGHVRPALDDAGDLDTVTGLLDDLLARGNGAAFQRAAYQRGGRILDVITGALEQTARA